MVFNAERPRRQKSSFIGEETLHAAPNPAPRTSVGDRPEAYRTSFAADVELSMKLQRPGQQ
jgi:hypothetical protein